MRKMDQGYTGHRPRVQLVHGDADATITYKNMAQAINEWSNVLGLTSTPTSTTSSGLTLGTHQATEQQWKNSCGYLVLDALTSVGGDHGPSDALFEAKYAIPFLGLDKTGAVDPEIAQCGGGGAAGTGGASSVGGTSSVGGATGVGGTKSSGGTGSATGGKSNVTGGASSVAPTGGTSSAGGAPATGGQLGVGGGIGGSTTATQTGGRTGAGGNAPTGGNAQTGGNLPTGGQLGQGGNLGAGGALATATGGSSVVHTATGGSATATGGTAAVSNSGPSPAADSGGCSCTVAGTSRSPTGLLAMTLGALLVLGRRKKR